MTRHEHVLADVSAYAYEWETLRLVCEKLNLIPTFLSTVWVYGPSSNPYEDVGPFWNLQSEYEEGLWLGLSHEQLETVIEHALLDARYDLMVMV